MLLEKQSRPALPEGAAGLSPRALLIWFWLVFTAFAAALVCFSQVRSIELWDESRAINNAFEMASRGHWMVPMYAGAPDHWYTKPPLLIWIQAFLMRVGLPTLWALRLPSELAGLGSVLLVVAFCRQALGQSFAGVVSGMLLMSSWLFFGRHMAINGDYDTLLCLFSTACAFGLWIYVEESGRLATAGLLTAGGALALAILTKGIAGVLPLPGLLAFVLLRGRARRTLSDWRLWAVLLAAFAAALAYYAARNRLDPGYFQAMLRNEISGRYGAVNEGHVGHWYFYLRVLLLRSEPGTLLAPLGLVALLRKGEPERRRSALLLCGVAPLTLLAILTTSATKLNYYCAPAIPLLVTFAGLGLAAVLRRPGLGLRRLHLRRVEIATLALLTVAVGFMAFTFARHRHQNGGEGHYGEALRQMEAAGAAGPIDIVEFGDRNAAGLVSYSPIAVFYATQARRSGAVVRVRPPRGEVRPGTWMLSCDPVSIDWLRRDGLVRQPVSLLGDCLYGQANAPR